MFYAKNFWIVFADACTYEYDLLAPDLHGWSPAHEQKCVKAREDSLITAYWGLVVLKNTFATIHEDLVEKWDILNGHSELFGTIRCYTNRLKRLKPFSLDSRTHNEPNQDCYHDVEVSVREEQYWLKWQCCSPWALCVVELLYIRECTAFLYRLLFHICFIFID